MDGVIGSAGYNLGGRVLVQAWCGRILETGAAVVVTSIGSRASFRGSIARSILEAAGPEIQTEVKRHGLVPPGSVVITHAGALTGVRYLFHTVVTRIENRYRADPELIVAATRRCILLADLLQQPSIALPAFGTGLGRARKEEAVEGIISGLSGVFPLCTSLDRVIFATTNEQVFALFNLRVLVVQALLQREQELKRALPELPPALYGLIGELLQQMERARETGANAATDAVALQQQAEAMISLGQELQQRLSREAWAPANTVQWIINTGNTIIENVNHYFGPVAAGGGDAVDLRGSQGAVIKPGGRVEQRFGSRE
ncbi:MAG: macro domain-containing protein [Anaerolineae bacterium]|nr:macro domain-containing protein [Anaerolineae bacterium]